MALYRCVKDTDSYDKHMIRILSEELNITDIAARLLLNKGIMDIETAHTFLYPNLKHLKNPYELLDMDKAVERLNLAIQNKEKITIYGDYDVDGVTASAILYIYLKDMGVDVNVYIPHRFEEGYGLNENAIREIHSDGTVLLITVDCGITSFDELELAKKLGMDAIVTDHHNLEMGLPPATAVINPKRNGNNKQSQLAGVGVAAKLIHALEGSEALKNFLDLIAIGTIADMVPLLDDNRIFAANGIRAINKSPRIGIKALADVCGLDYSNIKSYNIAFDIAPRLNAAGRMDTAMCAFELLISDNYQEALKLATKLDIENKRRQQHEAKIIKEANERLQFCLDSRDRIIVLDSEDWHPGIIGIAASKLVNIYNRPTILLTNIKDELYTGSARSIEGFDIYKAISTTDHILEKFGGHKQAAGLTVKKDNIPELIQNLSVYGSKNLHSDMLLPQYKYDLELNNEDISFDLYNDLEKFEPFGLANPMPTFLLEDAHIDNFKLVGKDKRHVQLAIDLDGRLWEGIWFNGGGAKDNLSTNPHTNMIVNLNKNEWNGFTKLQLKVKSLEIQADREEYVDNLLRYFYSKFFDDFYNEFLYNKSYKSNLYSDTNVNISGYVDREEMYNRLKESYSGNLILLNERQIAKKLIMSLLDRKLMGHVELGYGDLVQQNGRGINGVVMIPNISQDRLNEYENLFVMEEDIFITKFRLKEFKNKVWVVRKNNDIEPIRDFILTRDDFIYVYRWLQCITDWQYVWQDMFTMLNEFNKTMKSSLNYFQFCIILEVFSELSFISYQIDNGHVRVLFNTEPETRNLNESSFYRYYSDWLSDMNIKNNSQ